MSNEKKRELEEKELKNVSGGAQLKKADDRLAAPSGVTDYNDPLVIAERDSDQPKPADREF